MRIGSQAHKELFCRTFFEGHRTYEPADLPWPDLDDDALALLRSLPFWTHARQFESDAGPMIRAVAKVEPDPMIREALELQAFEEERHARLVNFMIDLYGLAAEETEIAVPSDPIAEFIHFGFEECLDSFGGFGFFKIARDTEFLPDPLFEVFDNVMREESHHIVFFVNWFAHRESNRGRVARLLRIPRSLVHYGRALRQIKELLAEDDAEEGADFLVRGAEAFVDHLTPQLVLRSCLSENELRLATFDRRLLVPSLIPRLAALGAAALSPVPERWFAGRAPTGDAASASERSTPRAA